MNESLEIFLWVIAIISGIILFVAGIIYGASSLNTYMEEDECEELRQKGYDAIVIDEGHRNDCKLIYKGAYFDSLELESILMLKLKEHDALHAVSEPGVKE